jgi:hypothetical protein
MEEDGERWQNGSGALILKGANPWTRRSFAERDPRTAGWTLWMSPPTLGRGDRELAPSLVPEERCNGEQDLSCDVCFA